MAVFKVPFARTPLALAWTCLAGAALYCYFVFLVSFASSQRGGNLLSMLIVFPVMMIGGSFFPSDFMPPWMAAIGRWTPNGLAATQLHEILFGTPRAATLVLMALAIAVPAVVAFFLCARRIVRRFAVA
jgi:ABC-type multidrug transport system permease subunit